MQVLIETLWNVKEQWNSASFHLPRINRNIVECKDKFYGAPYISYSSINRNIVECKVLLIHQGNKESVRINRNIVECKVNSKIDRVNS